jgi:hypothetical protein
MVYRLVSVRVLAVGLFCLALVTLTVWQIGSSSKGAFSGQTATGGGYCCEHMGDTCVANIDENTCLNDAKQEKRADIWKSGSDTIAGATCNAACQGVSNTTPNVSSSGTASSAASASSASSASSTSATTYYCCAPSTSHGNSCFIYPQTLCVLSGLSFAMGGKSYTDEGLCNRSCKGTSSSAYNTSAAYSSAYSSTASSARSVSSASTSSYNSSMSSTSSHSSTSSTSSHGSSHSSASSYSSASSHSSSSHSASSSSKSSSNSSSSDERVESCCNGKALLVARNGGINSSLQSEIDKAGPGVLGVSNIDSCEAAHHGVTYLGMEPTASYIESIKKSTCKVYEEGSSAQYSVSAASEPLDEYETLEESSVSSSAASSASSGSSSSCGAKATCALWAGGVSCDLDSPLAGTQWVLDTLACGAKDAKDLCLSICATVQTYVLMPWPGPDGCHIVSVNTLPAALRPIFPLFSDYGMGPPMCQLFDQQFFAHMSPSDHLLALLKQAESGVNPHLKMTGVR